MFDPCTVAFEIKSLFKQKPSKMWPKGYRNTWVTIWHKDPCTDGSDDSCGWSYPKPPEWLIKKIAKELKYEIERDPGFLFSQREREGWPVWFMLWMNRASFFHRRRGFSPAELAEAFYNCSFPGSREHRQHMDEPDRQAWIIARCYMDVIRPWYRHPKYHFWHWEFQIHLLQAFKRWAFSRCAHCQKGFKWGYTPVSHNWSGNGATWFGESGVYHSECSDAAMSRPKNQEEQ